MSGKLEPCLADALLSIGAGVASGVALPPPALWDCRPGETVRRLFRSRSTERPYFFFFAALRFDFLAVFLAADFLAFLAMLPS
jgi:hypothetical protein